MRYMRSWNVGNTSGQYGHFQLWNKGVDTDLIVYRPGIGSPADATFQFLWTDIEAQHSIADVGAGSDAGIASDGSLGTLGQLRLQVTSSLMVGGQLVDGFMKASTYHGFDEFEDWHIPPQMGLLIRCGTPNIPFFGSFVWDE